MRRFIARLGVAALLAGGGLAVAAPAQAAACPGKTGVTVVVQSGSTAKVRCARGNPASGGAALKAAGFSVERVQTQPGAVCKIGGLPKTSCVRMPPTSRYWAFFHAPAGGSWSYSKTGIYAYNPKPGTVVGFRLGSGAKPSIAPPKVAAKKPKPKPKPPKTQPKPKASAQPTTATTQSDEGTDEPTQSDEGTDEPTQSDEGTDEPTQTGAEAESGDPARPGVVQTDGGATPGSSAALLLLGAGLGGLTAAGAVVTRRRLAEVRR